MVEQIVDSTVMWYECNKDDFRILYVVILHND